MMGDSMAITPKKTITPVPEKKRNAVSAEIPEPKKMGAPVIKIDMDQLGALCRMKPSLYDCARFFKCSEDTIERRVKEAFNVTFAEFRDQNMVHTKFDLIRKAIQKADVDPMMHRFCLKNLADWRDKTDVTSDGKVMAPPAQVTIVLPANGREGKK
jgi:hypothetical protein